MKKNIYVSIICSFLLVMIFSGVMIYSHFKEAHILGIGRNAAYAIVKKGYFSTVRIGGTIRISKRSFDAWLDEDSKPCQVCDDN